MTVDDVHCFEKEDSGSFSRKKQDPNSYHMALWIAAKPFTGNPDPKNESTIIVIFCHWIMMVGVDYGNCACHVDSEAGSAVRVLRCRVCGLGFRVQRAGFRGLRLGIWDLGLRV